MPIKMGLINCFGLLNLGKKYLMISNLKLRTMSITIQPKFHQLTQPKTGILMLNMGGPTSTDKVEDYLCRIMTDTDIIQLPIQSQLGPWIAKSRTSKVQEKYKEIGGYSPIFEWTNKQGKLLVETLDKISLKTAPHKYYVGFRYADPLIEEALQEIENDGIEHVIIFSQYPQYSCSTSGSSFNAIYKFYKDRIIPDNIKWSIIDRWATHPLLIKTFAKHIKEELSHFPDDVRKEVIILFSAHSIPMQTLLRGDSYPAEIGATVQLVMKELNYCNSYDLVWQSKVGPLKWLKPFTDEALEAYKKQGKNNFILVPIAFVNDHIETLHEMDIEYCKDLGKKLNIKNIRRAKAPNDDPLFIKALADIVITHIASNRLVTPKFLNRCPHCSNKSCIDSKAWFSKICNAKN